MLFSEIITELKFNQASDLKMVVDHLKSFTFQEDDGSKIHEFFCLYIFLVGSFKLERLYLPIKIISRESPDFTVIYENQNREIGIEHTKATIESYKIAESELKKHPEGSVIELCHYSPFVKMSKKQSDVGIISPKSPLKGEGWSGNQVEYEWAETILNAIKKKVEVLNEPHFEVKANNALFIEDDSPVEFVKHEDDAIKVLKEKYIQVTFSEKYLFNNVHIFSNGTLIYDIFGECIKIGLRKKELEKQVSLNVRRSK